MSDDSLEKQSHNQSAQSEKLESIYVIAEQSEINNDHATHALGFFRLQLLQ